jgi:hypothetical protein
MLFEYIMLISLSHDQCYGYEDISCNLFAQYNFSTLILRRT